MKEDLKYTTIKNLVDNNVNKHRAASKLNCSYRNINHLICNYLKFGKDAFRHKNNDCKAHIALDDALVKSTIYLYSSKYSGFNFKHFNEFLKSDKNISISYKALYSILSKHGFLSPKARRCTKRKAINVRFSNDTIRIDIVSMISNQIDIIDSHSRQERLKYFGEIIQIDASNHL